MYCSRDFAGKKNIKNLLQKVQCTVVELYTEGVTKLFHEMEVNETLILFLHLANERKYTMSDVAALHILSKKWLFLLKIIKNE